MSYYDNPEVPPSEIEEIVTTPPPSDAKKKLMYGWNPKGVGVDFGIPNQDVVRTDLGANAQYPQLQNQLRPEVPAHTGRVIQRELMNNPMYYNRDIISIMCDKLVNIEKLLTLLVKNDQLLYHKERGRTFSSVINLPADTLIYIDFEDPARNRNVPVGTVIRNPGQPFSKLIAVNKNGPGTIFLDSNVDQVVSEVSTPLPPTAAIDLPSSYPSISSLAVKTVGGPAELDLIGII